MNNIGGVNNNANIRNTPPLNKKAQAAKQAASVPAKSPEVKPDLKPTEVKPSTASIDQTQKVNKQEGNPVEVSFQVPAAASEKNTIQSVRRLGKTENTEALLSLPDLPASADLSDAVDYYRSAVTAAKEGALDMANDFLAWARELDPGAPDLPRL